MDSSNKQAALAAAVILVVFGLVAFYLPTIMLTVGSVSPAAAGAVAVLFRRRVLLAVLVARASAA